MLEAKNNKKRSKFSGYEKRRLDYRRKNSYQKQERIFEELVIDENLRKRCLGFGKISSYVSFLESFAKLFPNKIIFQNTTQTEKKILEFPKKWKYVMSHCRCIDSRNFIDGIRTTLKKLGLYPQGTKSDSFLYLPNLSQKDHKMKGRKRIKIQEKLTAITTGGGLKKKKRIFQKAQPVFLKKENGSSIGISEPLESNRGRGILMIDPIDILINLHKFKPKKDSYCQPIKEVMTNQSPLVKTEEYENNFQEGNFGLSCKNYHSLDQSQNQKQNLNLDKNFNQLMVEPKKQIKREKNENCIFSMFSKESKKGDQKEKNNQTNVLTLIKSECRSINRSMSRCFRGNTIKIKNENEDNDQYKSLKTNFNLNMNKHVFFQNEDKIQIKNNENKVDVLRNPNIN
ncbi:hypothetical protein M0812_28997 [Anaeramoeba flamelloides]|uniref:Uncharacterized protein n=1 Tax=Anaeramoeba flamelloides TaxID=1746091 RepID=A0AAV7Y6L2_9EUKA|nr:hypothetical protein M0812_28997 [Anaeramoeba flamelloides]